jgi:hypothetical protein
MIFLIVLPFLGVFVYLIAQSKGVADRDVGEVEAPQQQFDQYVRSVAGSAAPRRRSTRRSSCWTVARSRGPISTRSRPRRSGSAGGAQNE